MAQHVRNISVRGFAHPSLHDVGHVRDWNIGLQVQDCIGAYQRTDDEPYLCGRHACHPTALELISLILHEQHGLTGCAISLNTDSQSICSQLTNFLQRAFYTYLLSPKQGMCEKSPYLLSPKQGMCEKSPYLLSPKQGMCEKSPTKRWSVDYR
jgi:hypothetical protein